jgi:hypothetical protein
VVSFFIPLIDCISCGATAKRRFVEGKKVVTGDFSFWIDLNK